MINEIDILHEGHCCNFACHTGEKPTSLLCLVSYHQEVVIKLGEYGFDSFSKFFVSPRWRTPVFLVQPIRNFKCNICDVKEILLNFSTQIPFVTEHHTVVIFPLHIFKIMQVMDTCCSHIEGVDYSTYPADSVELIPVIIQTLRGAITPVGSCVNIVTSHGTAFCPCVLTNFYRLGINAENILGAIDGISHFLTYFLGKLCRQLTAGIELSSANQVWQIIFALIVQTMKQEIFAVKVKCFSCDTESNNLNVRKFWNDTTARYISEFINTIPGESLAYPENFNEICYEVAHKQCNSS